MDKRQISNVFRIKILFVLMLFLLSGCVTPSKPSKAPKPEVRKRVLDDVLVFRNLQEVDLDNDGVKEIVAIYATGKNSTGVKVIKFHNDKGDVIFKHIFNTLDVKFAMRNKVPIITVEELVQVAPGCTAARLKNIYRWDGKAFTLSGK